ncbi:Uncharacterized membrane protein YcfT [Raineyella antarctica]|uniref:Uncharacterized membrane protein YcfT n=2 Tax=Raineyella antarctica TaxID=1577474 RepID=A0A1G6GDS1_9ACTN|nr:Uncharacterized membrane protein YcfT [Raineyella antarctica]
MVVLLHASLTTDAETAWVVNDLLRPYRMPTLMVLSGLLLQRSLAKGTRRYLLGKLRGVVWPWLLWTVVMVLLLTERWQADPVGFLAVGTHLWFLAALGASYGVALLTREIPPLLVAFGLFSGAGLLQDQYGALTTYLWYSAFFFVGAALPTVLDRWLAARPLWPLVLTGVSLLGAVWQVPRGLYVPFRPDQALISVAGVLAAIWLAARLPRSAPVLALEWVGRNSIVTYLAHAPLLVPVGAAVDRIGLGPTGSTLLSFVVALAVSMALTLARPWTGWLYSMPPMALPGAAAVLAAVIRMAALPADVTRPTPLRPAAIRRVVGMPVESAPANQ